MKKSITYLVFILAFGIASQVEAQKRPGKLGIFFQKIGNVFQGGTNYNKMAGKDRANKRQKANANTSFGRGTGGSVYISGSKVVGIEGMYNKNRLTTQLYGEYFFNEELSTMITVGYNNSNYYTANRNVINLFADGKYNIYNINSTIYFSAFLGGAVASNSIKHIEATKDVKPWLYGASGGLGVTINVMPTLAISSKFRQVLYLNDNQRMMMLTFGIQKTL